MNAIDVFSCIGCHALGFERAGIGVESLCEINEDRKAILRKQFPKLPIYHDIRTFQPRRADIIIGGPPCQQTSVAAAIHGKRTGESLWPEMRRVADLADAAYVIVEQPPGNAAWEAQVAADLRRDGYHTARVELTARQFGAPYLRRRVFIIACSSLPGLEVAWRALPSTIERVKRAADARGDWNPDKLGALRVDARSAGEMDRSRSQTRRGRIEALGDSNPPHMAEAIGRAILTLPHQIP